VRHDRGRRTDGERIVGAIGTSVIHVISIFQFKVSHRHHAFQINEIFCDPAGLRLGAHPGYLVVHRQKTEATEEGTIPSFSAE
jgi:hypothetical protein